MDKSTLRQHARDLRKNGTDAERHLWYYLRANRFGYKFKRQVPIKRFIVDFVCLERRLIVELDGGQHQDNQAYDDQRTIELNQVGFQVLRFWNNDVLMNTEGVLEVIRQTLSPTLSRELAQGTVHFTGAGEGADLSN
jgi:very-short-patch-repair endonuclease